MADDAATTCPRCACPFAVAGASSGAGPRVVVCQGCGSALSLDRLGVVVGWAHERDLATTARGSVPVFVRPT